MSCYQPRSKFVGLLGLAVLATWGCAAGGPEEEENVVQAAEALSTASGFYMSDDGRIHSTAASPDWSAVTSLIIAEVLNLDGTFYGNHPHRGDIIMDAYYQNKAGLCGDAARSKYNAEQGHPWCTEYARWVMRDSNGGQAPNVRYCNVDIPLVGCVDHVYLSEADTVSDMVELFDAHDGWIAQSSIKASSPQPGDYLALKGSDGKRLGHSALVMAVSSDSRYIYTSEGNVNDCVKFMKRRFFTDGQLNSDINGLGKLQTFY